MAIRLDQIIIEDFKRIESLTIDLKPITALVGGNTSGKSSALQAAQLGVSILQAAYKKTKSSGIAEFAGTVANDAVLFRPTEHLLDLRRGDAATQNLGYSISYKGVDVVTLEEKFLRIEIKRGKNANIAINRIGDEAFATQLADIDRPFSILTPGLSGIPLREEWRTKGAMDAAVMHGDANLYLRTVLDHLFNSGLDQTAKSSWKSKRDITLLPEGDWKTFSVLLERCYPTARIIVEHDQRRQRYVAVDVEINGSRITLDMASTGMLQVIQILAYACFYRPPLLLLDEPDAHLHADSQSRLYEALRGVASETQTRILFASHSPQLIQRLMYDQEAALIWMSEGAQVPVDEARRPAIPILMTLGALSAGADAFDPSRKTILLTEDKLTQPVAALAKANGAAGNIAILSYNGCGNLTAARLLAGIIADFRPDVRIVIHRDRDFRTAEEMRFEMMVAEAEHARNGVERVFELFTPFNDVEHSFAQADHLKKVFSSKISSEVVDSVIEDVIHFFRDDLVNAARIAREQVNANLYQSARKRRKGEWGHAGMPDVCPSISGFIPQNGTIPVAFEQCHGKKLLDAVRHKIHGQIHGSSRDVEDVIFNSSEFIFDQAWCDALSGGCE